MKRYFDLNKNTDSNYCDVIDSSYMVEIPDDGKPYGLVKNEVVDISQTPEYIAEQALKAKEQTNAEIQKQINELDIKRIRAIAEPSQKTTNQSWLEFYTGQIQALRAQLNF